jgi:hypothetical protein
MYALLDLGGCTLQHQIWYRIWKKNYSTSTFIVSRLKVKFLYTEKPPCRITTVTCQSFLRKVV